MSDAAHPADPRGSSKPRKAGGESAGDPKKKPVEKIEPGPPTKPKSRDKDRKPVRTDKASGSNAELTAGLDDSREASATEKSGVDPSKSPRDGTSPTSAKSDSKSDSREGAGGGKSETRHKAKGDPREGEGKSKAKADSHGDSSSVTAAAEKGDDARADKMLSSSAGESREAGMAAAAAEAEAADLPELLDLPDVAPDEDEKFHAMCAWLSAAALVLAMVCPFYFVGPLLYWLRYRRRSRFVAFHAKQGLWWSLLVTLLIWVVGVASGLVLGSIFGLEFAGLNLVALVPVQVTVIIWFSWIGLKALHGVKYRTPIVGGLAEAAPQKWF